MHQEQEFENDALLRLDFDASNQGRLYVSANSCAASLWNMKRDELLLSFANYDLPLPCFELDWLRFLVSYMQAYFRDESSHYIRFINEVGFGARAKLVCLTSVKTFNAIGQITQVCLRMID